MNEIYIALLTGLTAGGISCLSVQGGLLASSVSQESSIKTKRYQTAGFLVSKLVAYTLLGGLLGYFGSSLKITPIAQGWLQIFAGIYMLAVAANLLNLHPIFRYTVIQPPKWAFRLIKKESKRELVGPIILGALTVLIPCGITQGMMIAAIASGNALTGALLLGAFTLGTSPLFFFLGLAAVELMRKRSFAYVASLLIIILGINAISSGNGLRGSVHTIQNYVRALTTSPQTNTGKMANLNSEGKQEVTIDVTSSGYNSTVATLRSGVPVKIRLVSSNAVGCARAFTIPSLNISKILPENGEEFLEFTPQKPGRLAFSCSMGMFSGAFQVI